MKQKLYQFTIDNVVLPCVGIALCLMLWAAFSRATYDALAESSFLPSPMETWQQSSKYLINPFTRDETTGTVGIGLQVIESLILVAKGYSLALIVAVPVGFLLGASKLFARAFDPIFQILRPVSPLAWFPLAMLIVMPMKQQIPWVKPIEWQCIFTIAICSVWPTILNTAVGVRAIPQDYINVAKVLRLSHWGRFTKVLLPATMPYMFTGFRLSLGIAWLVIVAAEMLAGKAGIGYFLRDSYNAGNYGAMIASIIVIGVVGFILDRLMNVVEKNVHVILGAPRYARAGLTWFATRRAEALGVRVAKEASHVAS